MHAHAFICSSRTRTVNIVALVDQSGALIEAQDQSIDLGEIASVGDWQPSQPTSHILTLPSIVKWIGREGYSDYSSPRALSATQPLLECCKSRTALLARINYYKMPIAYE